MQKPRTKIDSEIVLLTRLEMATCHDEQKDVLNPARRCFITAFALCAGQPRQAVRSLALGAAPTATHLAWCSMDSMYASRSHYSSPGLPPETDYIPSMPRPSQIRMIVCSESDAEQHDLMADVCLPLWSQYYPLGHRVTKEGGQAGGARLSVWRDLNPSEE